MPKEAPHSPEFEGNRCVSAVDWLGNRFTVGDQVMYCISAGRGQMMAIGEVIQIKHEIQERKRRIDTTSDDPDAIYYAATEWYPELYYKWELVPHDVVTVQVRTLKTSGRWDNEKRSKPAWVNPMNITALNHTLNHPGSDRWTGGDKKAEK